MSKQTAKKKKKSVRERKRGGKKEKSKFKQLEIIPTDGGMKTDLDSYHLRHMLK